MKVVRELGSERCETVRSLSTIGLENVYDSHLVRKEWNEFVNCLPIVTPVALSGSYTYRDNL